MSPTRKRNSKNSQTRSKRRNTTHSVAHRTLTPEEREARWQELTFGDDFLFSKILQDPELCRELIHRIFPNFPMDEVNKLSLVQTQKAVKLGLHLRGVRFDVFTIIARSIFDLEMQKEMLADLFRRIRAYHIVCGHDALNMIDLKKSGNYKDLPDVYVVFICLFDPFKGQKESGYHMYSCHVYRDNEKSEPLNDGMHTVLLNATGTREDDVNPKLKNFLDFVATNKVPQGEESDPFISLLAQRVKEAKENIKWRREFMRLLTVEDEKYAEGLNKGLAKGREEGITIGEERTQRAIYERLTANGMSAHEASIMTGWNM